MPGLDYRRQGYEWRIKLVAADEFDCIDTWLYATLTADSTLMGLITGIYEAADVPEKHTYPFVSYWFMAAEEDQHTFGDDEPIANMIYVIEVWDQATSYESIGTVNKRLRTLLPAANVTTADGTIISCKRRRPWRQGLEEE